MYQPGYLDTQMINQNTLLLKLFNFLLNAQIRPLTLKL